MEEKRINVKDYNSTKKWWANIGNSWIIFVTIILNPFVLMFSTVSIILILYSSRQPDKEITTILTIISSVITGLLGGIVAKKWDDLTQEKVIMTRAKSATRNLKLLLERSISLEKRVFVYFHRHTDSAYQPNITPEVIKTYFEEIIEECISIENFTIIANQDWVDIIPEADMQIEIDIIRELKNKVYKVQENLNDVIKELEESKELSTNKIEGLVSDKNKLENELVDLRLKAQQSAIKIGVSNISGSFISGGTISTNSLLGDNIVETIVPLRTANIHTNPLSLEKNDTITQSEENGKVTKK